MDAPLAATGEQLVALLLGGLELHSDGLHNLARRVVLAVLGKLED